MDVLLVIAPAPAKASTHTCPEPTARPAVEAVVDRRRRAVFRRAVAPSAPSLENMDNARDDAPVIDAPRAGLVLGKMRLNRGPLRIAQPEKLAHHHLQKTVWKL